GALAPRRAKPAPPRAPKRERSSERDSARRENRWPRVALAAALGVCVLATVRDGVSLAITRRSRLDAGLLAALDTLRARTPENATVLSLWEEGYVIQARAGRRTLVDGLLESPVVKRRVVEIDGALMQASPDSLAAVCRREGAGWLLVPPSTSLLGI